MNKKKKPKQNSTSVSLKIPTPLFTSLLKITEQEHFMDVSELVKNIIRKNYLENNDPDTKINKLKQDIVKKLETKINSDVQEQVIQQLTEIKKMLDGGDKK